MVSELSFDIDKVDLANHRSGELGIDLICCSLLVIARLQRLLRLSEVVRRKCFLKVSI